jgi:ornithine carbamoyltransferase
MAVPITSLSSPRARHLANDLDLNTPSLLEVLELATQIKGAPSRFAQALTGKYLTLLFEKPSLRTRMTFELAIKQLGGDAVTAVGPIADREPVKDVARNLDRWTHGIVARVFSQSTIDELAAWSSVPVINALSDRYHPCQALADVLTLREQFGKLEGLKLAFVGDGNNVAHSLMLTGARLGIHVTVATPRGYEPDSGVIAQAAAFGRVTITNDPREAVSQAHAVYTDVWASMGQESEAARRADTFKEFQVNDGLYGLARPDAVFMHCLPAKRGQEVTDSVMEAPRSVIFDQAENRLHAQKALLVMLLA